MMSTHKYESLPGAGNTHNTFVNFQISSSTWVTRRWATESRNEGSVFQLAFSELWNFPVSQFPGGE